MTFGSFCWKKEDDLQVLQPELITIKGKQIGFLSYFDIIQTVENKTGKDLEEIMYIFPTDNRLCLYGLTFYIREEKIEAKIENTEHSKEIFEEAKKTKKTTVISEYISSGLASICIGNVPKNEKIKVVLKCSLMSQLSSPNKILTKIPLYGCDSKGYFLDLADLSSLTLNVDIDIIQFSAIKKVNVNFDDFSYDETKNKILIQSGVIMNDNLIIEIELSEKVKSQMVKCEKVAALSIIPEFTSKQKSTENKDFVFLIDCSASMIGESIQKAKESINLFISRVPANSKFNIIQFGTKYEKIFDKSVEANQANKEIAKEKVSNIKANFGGTEMLQLFEELFDNNPSCQREIFLITDGEVYKREDVVKLIDTNKEFNRIFAIGLGNGADAGFLDEIAELTNGKSDFIYDSEELPDKISEHLELSLTPSATDVEIHIEGEISPFPLPPLLPHVVRHVFVRSSSESSNDALLITSKIPNNDDDDDEIEIVINDDCLKDFQIDKNEKNPILPLFAHKQLKKLEKSNKEMAIQLSLESGVLCNYTSYVGVSSISYVKTDDHHYDRSLMDHYDRSLMDHYDRSLMDSRLDMLVERYGESLHAHEMIGSELSFDSCILEECSMCSLVKEEEPQRKPTLMSKVKNFFGHFRFWGNKKEEPEPEKKEPEPEKKEPEPEQENLASSRFESEEQQQQPHHEDDLNFDPNHAWNNNAGASEIVKLQSRDGFWDISTKFMAKHFSSESDIPSIGKHFGNVIIEKRVRSTVFVLAFLTKFHSENFGGNSQSKALKWLNKINKTVNWDEIIAFFRDNIQTQNIN
ncbi:von Willebrand factor A domain-containing protein 5A [Tritrichomonas musculus]|uniref:von Willebrand factor A domain-containing protein 5A n=1 Tax=Tritrichomonas musculus TaxID=1915356 RepID=A0ABR2HBC9_9EUKA